MLVLSRKSGEKIRIGTDIVLTVLEIRGGRIRLGIDAPTEIEIRREEPNGDVRVQCVPEGDRTPDAQESPQDPQA